MQPDPSLLDVIDHEVAAMPAGVHSISNGNHVRVIDTPNVWGQPMTQQGVAGATASVAQLAQSVQDVIANANFKVDIVSLNPADGVSSGRSRTASSTSTPA
jgi:hypothetical protein